MRGSSASGSACPSDPLRCEQIHEVREADAEVFDELVDDLQRSPVAVARLEDARHPVFDLARIRGAGAALEPVVPGDDRLGAGVRLQASLGAARAFAAAVHDRGVAELAGEGRATNTLPGLDARAHPGTQQHDDGVVATLRSTEPAFRLAEGVGSVVHDQRQRGALSQQALDRRDAPADALVVDDRLPPGGAGWARFGCVGHRHPLDIPGHTDAHAEDAAHVDARLANDLLDAADHPVDDLVGLQADVLGDGTMGRECAHPEVEELDHHGRLAHVDPDDVAGVGLDVEEPARAATVRVL